MNQYVTGTIIKKLREKNKLTQVELADKLLVSDKTISKWETGKGYPDISLLGPISETFGISITELLSGNAIKNMNVAANMKYSQFYICPICGNVIHSIGEAVISCHGVQLMPTQAEEMDEYHKITLDYIEDEWFIQINHSMTKEHYISFVSGVSTDGIQIVKLYPEGSAECRINLRGLQRVYYYCNKDGLFYFDLHKKR